MSESLLISAILSFSGGLQDTYTYLIRGEVFANAQTGNVVLLSRYIMTGDFKSGLHYLLPVIAFVIGIIVAEQIDYRFKYHERLHWRQIILVIQSILLVIVGILPLSLNTLANMLVSLSCAMQVQSFRKVRGHSYASTMIIGNIRSGTESFSKFLRDKNRDMLLQSLYYYGIILVFALGAGIGSLLSNVLGIYTIWASALLLLISCMILSLVRPNSIE